MLEFTVSVNDIDLLVLHVGFSRIHALRQGLLLWLCIRECPWGETYKQGWAGEEPS